MLDLDRELKKLQEETTGVVKPKVVTSQPKKCRADSGELVSGWGPTDSREDVPTEMIPNGMHPEDIELFLLRLKLEKVKSKMANPVMGPEEFRSPSPEPTYDANGRRTNTREVRYKEKLTVERDALIKSALEINKAIVVPSDYKPEPYTTKIMIPVKEYPEYNFIGLILGPRGNTQKKLERETNTRISIRGKGAVKEGKSRTDPKNLPGGNEDLHIVVTASNKEDLDRAATVLRKMLVPVEEEKNETKRRQLRELAAFNGTLRDFEVCRMCGEVGHRSSMCPNRRKNWSMANVCCAICGDKSHPTSDCPQMKEQGHKYMEQVHQMDSAYDHLMEDIGGRRGRSMRSNDGPGYGRDHSRPTGYAPSMQSHPQFHSYNTQPRQPPPPPAPGMPPAPSRPPAPPPPAPPKPGLPPS